MNKALLKFHEYPISETQLSKLSNDERAAFSVLCFAVTEINSISRILFFHKDYSTGYAEIDAGMACHHFCMLRILSAKVFELTEFLHFRGRYSRTKEESLIRFGKASRKRLDEIEETDGLIFAKLARDQATFHYQLKPAKTRLESVEDEHIRSMYLHKLKGNSFYPLGEEVMFIGLINEMCAEKGNIQSAKAVIEQWTEWLRKASKLVGEIFSTFVEDFLVSRSPDIVAREKIYWVHPEIVSSKNDTSVPIFVREC